MATTKPSIAILPFVNISNDPDIEYFCDGVTEELINRLTKVEALRVISRTSVFTLKNSELDLRSIGRMLHVDNVLEGSVRSDNVGLRIAAQLIRVTDDSTLWAETYNRELKDIHNYGACTLIPDSKLY